MRVRLAVLLHGTSVRREPVLPRRLDPRRNFMQNRPAHKIRKRGRIPTQRGHHLHKPLHSDSVAAPLPENLHEAQSGALHRHHLDLQLRPADPNAVRRLGCLRLGREAGHVLYQTRRVRPQFKKRSFCYRIRYSVHNYRDMLREDLHGREELAEEP